MKNERNDPGAYVRKVQQGTKAYAQELLEEIERLRLMVANLDSEKRALLEKSRMLGECLAANEALRALAASRQSENQHLQEEVVSLRNEVDGYREDQEQLRAQLDGIRDETERHLARYSEVERQNSNLANLYVASYRLHGTLDRSEVLATIREIVANLIGSEEMALFQLRSEPGALELVDSTGIDPERYRRVALSDGRIGQTARSGEIYVAEPGVGSSEPTDGLTACIPLTLDGRVTGAIAIFRLLPQKAGFEELDRELFELLATHAATALHATGLGLAATVAG
jgi:hypothetical protein